MYKIMPIILFMLGLPFIALAQSTPITLFNAQAGWAVASNYVFGSNGLPMAFNAAYDPATSSAANYVITDEGSSDTFGSLSYTSGSTEQWTETTAPVGWATANVSFTSGSYSVNVVANSAALACIRNGEAAEYDLYLGPNAYDKGMNVTSAVNSAYRTNPALVPLMSQLASLSVTGRIVINNASQPSTPTACSVNHASVTFGFALVNRLKNQLLQYSLHLASLCLPGPDYVSCTHQPQNTANWYQVGAVTAVSDTPVGLSSGLSIVASNGAPISLPLSGPGTVTFNAVNFLLRIDALIQNNPAHLDTNIADWQISGLTYGTAIWGDSSVTTTWQGLNATAACNNSKCS